MSWARLPGVARGRAADAVLRTQPFVGHGEPVGVVAFDPRRDFTVLPWLATAPNRVCDAARSCSAAAARSGAP